MRGPPPKDPRLLTGHRRNRASTKATLPTEAEAAKRKVPPIPARKGKWRPEVIFWWEVTWTSPMAAEYIEADKPGLYILATLHQAFWTASNKDKIRFAAEIRQHEVRFGLSPVDRRRLDWTIEQGEAAAEKTRARRQKKQPKRASKKDPREVLKVMK